MPQHDVARRRRAGLVCACIGAVSFTAVWVAVPAAQGRLDEMNAPASPRGGCPFAHATPAQASARSLGGALSCLVNRQRHRHGLARLRGARALDRAAERFAEDMRDRDYFGHVSPEGRRLGDRVRSAHLRAVGEVLAWGCGRLSTPAAAVRGWLASPPHRRVVLSSTYKVIGAGMADGAPGHACRPAASTSVALLGRPR